MSELTPCNWCSLLRMRRIANERGVELIVKKVPKGETLAGWTSVRYADEEPSVHFMSLSNHCVC